MTYRPQAWIERDRPGAISVLADATAVIVEGVGAGRRDMDPWFDATVWVHADPEVATQRNIARGDDPQQFIEDWMAQENAFLADE